MESEPVAIAFTAIRLSPACKGTPYQVWVIVLFASSSSDRPIELGSTVFPFTKSSTFVSIGIWSTTVAAGESKTVPIVGERIKIRSDDLSAGILAVSETLDGLEISEVTDLIGDWGMLLEVSFWTGARTSVWLVGTCCWVGTCGLTSVVTVLSAIASALTDEQISKSNICGKAIIPNLRNGT